MTLYQRLGLVTDEEYADRWLSLTKDFPGAMDGVWVQTAYGYPPMDTHREYARLLGVAAEKFRKAGVERSTKSVDVCCWREVRVNTHLILLGWCITGTNTYRRSTGLITILVILLRETKVDKHNSAVGSTHHDICGLNIEMKEIVAMDILQCRGHLHDILLSRIDIHHAITLHHALEGVTLDILHYIVCRIVLLKDIVNRYHVRMLKTCYGARLLHKLITICRHEAGTTLRAKRYASRVLIAIIVFAREELLDTYQLIQHMVLSKIGNTKTSIAESISNFVLSSLKERAGFKFHIIGLLL